MTPEKREAFRWAVQRGSVVLAVAYLLLACLHWWALLLAAAFALLAHRLRTRVKGDAWLNSRLVHRGPAFPERRTEPAEVVPGTQDARPYQMGAGVAVSDPEPGRYERVGGLQ